MAVSVGLELLTQAGGRVAFGPAVAGLRLQPTAFLPELAVAVQKRLEATGSAATALQPETARGCDDPTRQRTVAACAAC